METIQHSLDTDDEPEQVVIQTDPTGRFERYSLCLGKGAYKEVYKAFDQEEGVEVAWNQLRIDHIPKRDIPRVLSEIHILESLRNENIINFFHSWVAKGLDGKDKVYFITELMTSGTLKGYIRRTKGPVKPKILKNWCRQILCGLAYLHSRNPPIIHRDLKCENIFINGNNGQAKIGDLGLAVVKHTDHVSSVLGTPEFLAPEVYDEKYDEKVDIYAFGMVVLEIVTKEYPYSECTNQAQIYRKVTSGIKPNALLKIMDEGTRSFIETCIHSDPKCRPSAIELLSHPFLSLLDPSLSSSSINVFDSLQPVTGLPVATASSAPSTHTTSASTTTPTNNTNTTMASSETPPDMILKEIQNDSDTISSTTTNTMTTNTSQALSQALQPTVVDAENHTFVILERPQLKKHDLSDSTCIVETLERPTQDQVNLKMLYGKPGTRTSEICFPFDLSKDTATDVVSEMIKENLIHDYDEALARRKLEEAIRVLLLGQIRSSSVELKSSMTNRSTPMTSPVLSPQLSASYSMIPPLSFIPNSHLTNPIPSTNPNSNPNTIGAVIIPRSLSPTRGSSPTRQDPMTFSDTQSYKSGSSVDALSIISSSTTPSNSSLSKSSQDAAVQARLRELQEINLKGLGSMGVNPCVRSSTQKSQSLVNVYDVWPITFGGNDKVSPTRRETVPIVSVNQSRSTHQLQAPIIPRHVSTRPTASDSSSAVPGVTLPPRHVRQRSLSSTSSVITGLSSEMDDLKLEKDI